MNPEEKKLLEETYEMSLENNKLLRKMFTIAKWARVARIIYWLVLIGISIGAFYFVQPYLEQLLGVYTGLQEGVSNISEILGG
jgi:hypothetical protein